MNRQWFRLQALSLIVLACLGCGAQKADQAPPVTASRPESLTVREQAMLVEWRAGLDSLSRRSPAARELLTFYDAHAIPARFVDKRHFQVLTVRDDSLAFFVVADPHPAVLGAGQSGVGAGFDHETRVLTLQTSGFGLIVRGLIMGHEIVHARDCVEMHEPPSPPLSDIWLIGEMHGHHAVYSMLNELTDGCWRGAAVASSKQRQETAVAQGRKPTAFTMGMLPDDEMRIRRCMTVETPADLSFLGTDLMVSANMLNIQQFAKNNDERTAGALEFLRLFYQRALSPTP